MNIRLFNEDGKRMIAEWSAEQAPDVGEIVIPYSGNPHRILKRHWHIVVAGDHDASNHDDRMIAIAKLFSEKYQ